MEFVYPGFLWLLSLISIPIIIHLFHFRKYKTLYFSSLQFIQKIEQENKSTQKLKHLLILLSRILLIIATVLAFAQPYIPANGNKDHNGNNVIALYLDNSFSMTAKGVEGELLSEGREIIRKIIIDAGVSTKFILNTNKLDGLEKRILTQVEALTQLDLIKESSITRNLDDVIRWQKDFIERENREQNQISSVQYVLVSDFQKCSFKTNKLSSDSKSNYYPIQLIPQVKSNFYIDSVYFAFPVHRINEPNELFVRMVNASDENAKNIELKVKLGNQKRGMFLDLKANEKQTTSFQFTPNKTGTQEGIVEIEDRHLFWDDTYYFNINIAKESAVLIIDGPSASKSISNVYSVEPFFKVTSCEQLSFSGDQLENKDLIVLNGLNEISSGLIEALIDASKQGITICIFPGDKIDKGSYSSLLDGLNLPSLGSLITNGNALNKIDYRNSFFKGMFDQERTSLNMPLIKKSYQVNAALRMGSIELLTQRNGFPLFMKNTGPHANYLFSTSLTAEFGDFTQNALFPALLLRIASLSKRDLPLFSTIGVDASIQIDLQNDDEVPLKLENNKIEFIPQIRKDASSTFISIAGSEATEKLSAGSYIIKDESELGRIAINYDRKESSTDLMDEKEIINAFENAGIKNCTFKAVTEGQSATKLELDKPFEYWRVFILLALLFILIEMILLRFWK